MKPVKFSLILFSVLVFTFVIHLAVLHLIGEPLWADRIILSYIVNYVLTVGIFLGLYRFRKRLRDQIGFLFMGGSLIKFLFFFILFYPSYRADGEMSSLEFAAFFTPYLIALVLEAVFTSKMLKDL